MPANNTGIKSDTGTIGYIIDTGTSIAGSRRDNRFHRHYTGCRCYFKRLHGDPHCNDAVPASWLGILKDAMRSYNPAGDPGRRHGIPRAKLGAQRAKK